MEETYVTEANILNNLGIYPTLLKNFFEEEVDHVVKSGILHTTPAGLAERGADGKGNHNIVGILGSAE